MQFQFSLFSISLWLEFQIFFLKWKKIFLLYHFWWRCLPTPGFSSKCSFVHSSMVPLSILNKYKGNQHLINKSLVKYAKTKYQNHNLLTNSLEKGVVKTICIKLWKFWIFHSIFPNLYWVSHLRFKDERIEWRGKELQ